ncbi:hypothetical protein BLNAU_21954 [Blattamonas nauphoetae]|uniref:Uncharacterized protein n=1 Tax=Blattamonas nauphoetae TaxID=2049346 RepID=A0ABQ9WUE2_9EUKA|nr:hypothetical protein BLNAU_21954 [Blattamonas nauphoetae]
MENKLSEALSSLFGRANQEATIKRLLFSKLGADDIPDWVMAFESLLHHAHEGRQFSDMELQTMLLLLNNIPCDADLVFEDDSSFTMRVKGELVSTSKHDGRSLWTLLTPTEPHHATPLLIAAEHVSCRIEIVDRVLHFWNGWLSHFFSAVTPSKLPFTPDNHSLHSHLVDVMCDVISSFETVNSQARLNQPPVDQKMLKKSCLSFLRLSKDYLVHLSQHAFANYPYNKYSIDSLLDKVMRFDLNAPTTEGFRRELKKEMISSALASSSPHFILTAELVCPLSDYETMDVVERIVGLLDSDCSLDDDTICRSACSLTVTTSETQISSLISSRLGDDQPTLDEWDEVEEFQKFVTNFVHPSLQQARHCAPRLTPTQLKHLIAPFINCLHTFFHQFWTSHGHQEQNLKGIKWKTQNWSGWVELSGVFLRFNHKQQKA